MPILFGLGKLPNSQIENCVGKLPKSKWPIRLTDKTTPLRELFAPENGLTLEGRLPNSGKKIGLLRPLQKENCRSRK